MQINNLTFVAFYDIDKPAAIVAGVEESTGIPLSLTEKMRRAEMSYLRVAVWRMVMTCVSGSLVHS